VRATCREAASARTETGARTARRIEGFIGVPGRTRAF
jgi:hypothetical protein